MSTLRLAIESFGGGGMAEAGLDDLHGLAVANEQRSVEVAEVVAISPQQDEIGRDRLGPVGTFPSR